MARIRSVHPGIWTDEAFVSLSPMARLLAIGLWNECDDQGIFEWKPLQLKMRLLPADNADVGALLSEMLDANMIAAFEVDGRQFGAVRNFGRFQRPKKPNAIHPLPGHLRHYVMGRGGSESSSGREAASSEPEDTSGGSPSEQIDVERSSVPPMSELVPNRFPTGGEIAAQMDDGGCREGGRKKDSSLRSAAARSRDEDDPAFAAFWAAYPRKEDKGHARKAWAAALRKTDVATIMAGLARHRFSDEPKYRPLAATWLNGERWEDAGGGDKDPNLPSWINSEASKPSVANPLGRPVSFMTGGI